MNKNIETKNRLDSKGVVHIGSGFVFAFGKSFKSGNLNIPLNIYVIPNKHGLVMKKIINLSLTVFITVFSFSYSYAQYHDSEIIQPIKLEGPRIGFTYISAKEGSKLEERLEENDINPLITQFGWQFETRFFTLENGTSGLVEGVILFGGMEQSKLLPSGSFLVGLRNGTGLEVGFGPNLSLTGVAYVFAVGYTASSRYINFPINLAIVPSKDGIRYSLLVGFNARRK